MDRIGDRWALLILRDLHAGPARFTELQAGLPGVASNLLTNRLRQLEADGLVHRRDAEYGTILYELTEAGEGTADLLFELAQFGAQFLPDKELRRPGNLRTIALTLRVGCQRAADPSMNVCAELIVDDERFALSVTNGVVDMKYGVAHDPEVTLTTSYEPFVAAGDGRMPLDEFASKHARVEGDPGKARVLIDLLGRALAQEGSQ
jgi:DNA-binding HxlR family transcriptional regulator